MYSVECIGIKMLSPTARKNRWLTQTADAFSQAVQLGLDAAQAERTSSRNALHKAVYRASRDLGLPSDYARVAVNAAVSLARSYYGLRRARRRASFPKVNGSQGIGLSLNAYKVIQDRDRFVLRISTGKRGTYVWLPLCVPAKYRCRMTLIHGDAKIFKRGDDWYVSLPIRIPNTPTVCDGERTFIGVDLGIVRHAVVATPDKALFFSGKADRHEREHFADLRRRYGQHRRMDRVKAGKGKEQAWMRDVNHKVSRAIVDAASAYPNPVIVLERLDGICHRVHGSKRFNRMIASWTFRQLADFIQYKAARAGTRVVFCDPRGTSKTCPKCGHASRSNRPDQGHFRCVACNYQGNADMVAARNIAAAGPNALSQEPTDTARPSGQTENNSSRPDGVKECMPAVHSDSNLTSS